MKKMKKIMAFLLIAVIAIPVSVLAACSGKNPLTGIEIVTEPSKATYYAGEEFNPAGMEVEATYKDNSKKTVTNYTYKTGPLTVDDESFTITYVEGNVTKTADLTLTITVNPLEMLGVLISSLAESLIDIIPADPAAMGAFVSETTNSLISSLSAAGITESEIGAIINIVTGLLENMSDVNFNGIVSIVSAIYETGLTNIKVSNFLWEFIDALEEPVADLIGAIKAAAVEAPPESLAIFDMILGYYQNVLSIGKQDFVTALTTLLDVANLALDATGTVYNGGILGIQGMPSLAVVKTVALSLKNKVLTALNSLTEPKIEAIFSMVKALFPIAVDLFSIVPMEIADLESQRAGLQLQIDNLNPEDPNYEQTLAELNGAIEQIDSGIAQYQAIRSGAAIDSLKGDVAAVLSFVGAMVARVDEPMIEALYTCFDETGALDVSYGIDGLLDISDEDTVKTISTLSIIIGKVIAAGANNFGLTTSDARTEAKVLIKAELNKIIELLKLFNISLLPNPESTLDLADAVSSVFDSYIFDAVTKLDTKEYGDTLELTKYGEDIYASDGNAFTTWICAILESKLPAPFNQYLS